MGNIVLPKREFIVNSETRIGKDLWLENEVALIQVLEDGFMDRRHSRVSGIILDPIWDNPGCTGRLGVIDDWLLVIKPGIETGLEKCDDALDLVAVWINPGLHR